MEGRVVCSFHNVSWRDKDHIKTHPGTKELPYTISLHCPLAQTVIHLWEQAQCQHSLPNLLKAPATMLHQICSSQSCFPQYWGYHERKPCQQHVIHPCTLSLRRPTHTLLKLCTQPCIPCRSTQADPSAMACMHCAPCQLVPAATLCPSNNFWLDSTQSSATYLAIASSSKRGKHYSKLPLPLGEKKISIHTNQMAAQR